MAGTKTKKKSSAKKTSTKVTKADVKKRKNIASKRNSNIKLIQSENSYMKPFVCLIIIIIILVIGYVIFSKSDKGKEIINNIKNGNVVITEDEKKFKSEFEGLNNDSVVSVKIKEDNNVIYSNIDEVLSILDSGSGIIFFGNSGDTNTRLVVSNLTDNIGDNNIYYLDIISNGEDIRDLYELNDNKAKLVRNGQRGYSDLLDYLDEYLDEYQITKMNGKKLDVGEKRLEIPMVVKVKNGKVVSAVSGVGTLEKYKSLIES